MKRLPWLFCLCSFWVITSLERGWAQSFEKQTITLAGKQRHYYIYTPKGLEKGKKYPAVIAYHGFESDPSGLRWLISPDALADEFQYFVVYPAAENKSWNAGRGFGSKNTSTDDLSFASALVDVVFARHPVDRDRVYAMGFSNGAQMVALMVCKMPKKIAAAAMVAHTMNIPDCNPDLKVPILLIHGAKDKLAPFEGGGKSEVLSHKDSITFFQKVNETKTQEVVVLNKPTVRCKSFPGAGTEVVDCICFNDGHSWPGGREFKTEIFGTTNKELNANRFIFEFFKKYRGQAPKRSHQAAIPTGLKPSGPSTAKSSVSAPKKAPEKAKESPKPAGPSLKVAEHKLKINKTEQRYFAYAPEVLDGTYAGIVCVFGPGTFNSIDLGTIFNIEFHAVKHRWLFIFPKTEQKKVAPVEADWLYHMVADARETYRIQAPNIYLLGYSQGGRVVQSQLCYDAGWISGAALVAYAWTDEPCPGVPSVPLFLLVSKADPITPYRGDAGKRILSLSNLRDGVLGRWTGNVTQLEMEREKTYSLQQWLTHNTGVELRVMETEWGGHGVPGTRFPYPEAYGKTFSGTDSVERLMAFFATYQHHDFGDIYAK